MAAAWFTKIEGGPKRVNHVAVLIQNQIYIMGGYYTGLTFAEGNKIDIYAFSIGRLQWRKLELTDEQQKFAPSMRYGHTAVSHKNGILLFGGRNEIYSCNKLFYFDCSTNTWSEIESSGRRPEPRDGHTSCIVGNKMYVFGGFIDEPFSCFAFGLFALDLQTYTWERVSCQGKEPECRDFHAAVSLGSKMYIFGGRGTTTPPYHSMDTTYPPELNVFDTATNTWSQVEIRSTLIPEGRRSLTMFVHESFIYIFGGYNARLEKHYDELDRFDISTQMWHRVKPVGVGPNPRRRQATVISGDRVYMHGGTSPVITDVHYEADDDETPLLDHDELFILDLRPSLQTLCLHKVIKLGLDASSLPRTLASDIQVLTERSKPKEESRQFPSA